MTTQTAELKNDTSSPEGAMSAPFQSKYGTVNAILSLFGTVSSTIMIHCLIVATVAARWKDYTFMGEPGVKQTALSQAMNGGFAEGLFVIFFLPALWIILLSSLMYSKKGWVSIAGLTYIAFSIAVAMLAN